MFLLFLYFNDKYFFFEVLENDAKAGDADIRLKYDSAYEDDSFTEDIIVSEVKNDLIVEEDQKSSHSCPENTDEDLKALCIQFEGTKTKISDSPKLDDWTHEDDNQVTIPKKDIKICRKQLSPNSSFGFVPHLNEHGEEKEVKKIDSEDFHSQNLKIKTEEISMIAKDVSQTFHDLAEEMSCAETNFNDIIQNVEEISDIIQRQSNESPVNSTTKSDKLSKHKDDFIIEKENEIISSSSDKYGNATDEKNAHAKKIDDVPFNFNADDRNLPEYFNPERKGYRETKRDYQEEKSSDKDESVNTEYRNNDEDVRDKSVESESQTIVDRSWKKRWYEAHPSLDNLISSQTRDPRLFRAHFLHGRPNIGEAGDVPLDRFYISNEVSNDCMNNHTRNQISSESPADTGEYSYSRSFSDEINHRSNSARPSDKQSERKTSSEKVSNANPQRIPYAWWRRKLFKQSHSSENEDHYSKESQVKAKEETCDSIKSEKDEDVSFLNDAEKTSETNATESDEIFFQASDKIHDKTTLYVKESKERKLKQSEDENKEVTSGKLVSDKSVNIANVQQQILSETNFSSNLQDETQSNPTFHRQDASICYQKVSETDNETQSWKQCVTNGDSEVQKKHFGHSEILSDEQKDKEVNQSNNHLMKDEYELNATCGCGDFAYAMNNANDQNNDSQTNITERDENTANEQSDENHGRISLEYFEEVIERVIQRQKNDSMESCEALDVSNDTDDESMYVESSDFSETDDFSMNDSMNDSMQDK